MNELPALFFEDGSVLHNPEPRQVAASMFMTWSSWAPDPRTSCAGHDDRGRGLLTHLEGAA
ncbi:MAG TPA: hypothetical protein VHZ55_22180 [Bryobacteraceae bacterium]|jgi:hypothetical protein|nr:hypothetical protein [Bryobacteraceae bacterium]